MTLIKYSLPFDTKRSFFPKAGRCSRFMTFLLSGLLVCMVDVPRLAIRWYFSDEFLVLLVSAICN